MANSMDSTGISLEDQLHEEMIAIYQHVGREADRKSVV